MSDSRGVRVDRRGDGGDEPLRGPGEVGVPARGRARRPRWWGEVLAVLFLLFGYDRVAALAGQNAAAATGHGELILRAESLVGLDVERRLNEAMSPHVLLGQVLSVYYDFAHAAVTLGVLGLVYVAAPAAYRRARSALLAVNAAALLLFLAIPVAPPRLLPGAGFVDIVVESGTWGSWESAGSAVGRSADLYAAMPSLHVAWAVWVLVTVRLTSQRPLWRWLSAAHLALTCTIVLVTGNHYIVDVLAGGLLSWLCWRTVGAPGVPARGDDRDPFGSTAVPAGLSES